jgi:hypothetical protein
LFLCPVLNSHPCIINQFTGLFLFIS